MGDHYYGNFENMDVLFYDQNTHVPHGNSYKYDKNAMRLNLRPQDLTGQENHRPARGKNLCHNSPDLGIFKIVTPELERFIGNNTGLTPKGNPIPALPSPEFPLFSLVSPEFDRILASIQNKTPTPTRVLREGNSVARQREVYVQGFAEALQHIHDQQNSCAEQNSNTGIKMQQVDIPSTTQETFHWTENITTADAPGGYPPSIRTENTCDLDAMRYDSNVHDMESREIPEHKVDFSEHITGETNGFNYEDALPSHNRAHMLPLPPIDLELQEIVKRERKKQKNRVAASKCRRKKLEREALLEVRVQQLKEKSIELNAVASALRQQVGELKQRVLEHVAFGCQLPAVTTSAY